MKKLLLLQRMDEAGMKILEDAGFQVDIPGDVSEEGLRAVVAEYDAIIVRGMVKLPASVIERAETCKVIGPISRWPIRQGPMPTRWPSRRWG